MKRAFLFLILVPCAFLSCTTIDLYEKHVTIPGHAWKNSFKPSFKFTIKDTTSPYQLYFIIRHGEKYNYNNIYINFYSQGNEGDSTQKARFDLTLATHEGWLGSGMDDIYEHRIPITPTGEAFYFRRSGDYQFTVEQIMREDPLQHVYDVGLRIEKKN